MALFQLGDFTLSSGRKTSWRIDCEALTDDDIEAVAWLLVDVLPPFGSVEGVPRGGLRLAAALEVYATEGPLLIVDDVCTTGQSMERHRNGREAIGAVIFMRRLRQRRPTWITPLFQMPIRETQQSRPASKDS